MDGGIFQPAMLVSWMVKMLKTWHEARRICGEWSCFHVFSCVHFHFRCIQIGFISRIYLTILDASTLAALCFNKPRGRFPPPLSRADLGGFPMSCASRKTPSSTATTTWLQFPIPKKDGLASVVQNVSSLHESSGAICSASHLLCLFVWMQLFTCKAGCKSSRFKVG